MQARDGSWAVPPSGAPTSWPHGRAVRVAVVGAGRTRQGTGPFVARRLIEHGADVVAVSTTAPHTAQAAAAEVTALSRRPCQSFTSVASMLGTTGLDAVAICSPAHAHAEHLRLALSRGLDTFCEKPLVDAGRRGDALAEARDVVDAFTEHRLVLHVNTQWPHALDHLRTLYRLDALPPLQTLRVELEPPVRGSAMVAEAVPHANSLLLALAPAGEASDLRVSLSSEQGALDVHFTWSALSASGTQAEASDITYRFRWRAEQPREAAFEVNGMRVERTVDMTRGYEIAFKGNGRREASTDPLAASVRAFIEAVCARPLPSGAILRNLELMIEIAGGIEPLAASTPGPVAAAIVRRAG
jgi:predicted dehydrogenase